MNILTLVSLLPIFLTNSFGQPDTTARNVYRVNLKYEGVGSLLFVGISSVGFKKLDRVAAFDHDDLAKLDPNQVNAFDRPVLFNDPTRFEQAQKRSDLFLNISILSPLLLIADKTIRKDALDLLTLYVVTHAVDNVIYFGSAFSVRRARPFTYNTDIPEESRIGVAKSNSFYSGHVSFSSTATFFLAKVFTDYHHIKGWKRIAIFSAMSVPPVLVGINRMEAGKHFRTDVMLGFAVGAACGILIPELHRRTKNIKSVSLKPYFTPMGQTGLTLTGKF